MSSLLKRFKDLLSEYNGKEIETARFLDCCSDVFSILDYFGSTAFLPVKIDVYGNINKIRTKYTSNNGCSKLPILL
jgi:pleckstrin family protein A (phosphoinositide binding specific) protein 8